MWIYSRLPKAITLTLASLTAVVMLAFGAQAETIFPVKGGKGDRGEQVRCPPGHYLIGLNGKTGLWIDQVGLVCSRFKGEPAYTHGDEVYVPPRGGNGGAPNWQKCDPDMAIKSINGAIIVNDSRPKYIRDIDFSCSRPANGAIAGSVTFGGNYRAQSTWSPFVTIPGVYLALGPQPCPPGEYATGLSIRYGQHVNAIGLICGTFHAAAADVPLFPPPNTSPGRGMENNTDRPGSDRARLIMDDPEICRLACVNDRKQGGGCRAWTWVKPGVQDARGVCYLKNPAPSAVPNACCISGKLPRPDYREPWQPGPGDKYRDR